MTRRHLPPVLLVLFLFAVSTPVVGQVVFNQIIDYGPSEARINIIILGDGYTAAEQAQFDADAVDIYTQFRMAAPFHAYRSYYNVFTIFVASNESGSDHPWSGIYRDTYFSSSYDCYGLQRLITIPPNDWDGDPAHGYDRVIDLLETYLPEYDIVILLVNDPQYGGSGGFMAITSTDDSAPEITLHELGHSFGYLADEYEDYTPGYSGHEAPNATAETVRELIRWTDWIEPSTPVPTPETGEYAGAVGLFEGAVYESTGWYRPKLDCRMRSISIGFCQVCGEQIIRSQYNLLSPIESVTPADLVIELGSGESVWLSVVPLQPWLHDLTIEWHLNDAPVGAGESLLVTSAMLTQTDNIARVVVSDGTSYVRTDLDGLLIAEHEWIISSTARCGDVDNNSIGPDIADLVYLVTYMFQDGPEPDDLNQCDYDSSGGNPDIVDLVLLVEYMFQDGPPLNCP